MGDIDGLDLDELLREATEIGVGAAILGLRRVNISRRELVERVPAAKPVVNAALDGVEAIAPPLSLVAGTMVGAIGDALPGPTGERLVELGSTLAASGPELLRLSGLTKRD